MILITGATDGIGKALARLYRERGERLVLVGRRAPQELDDPLFTPETYCRADLAHPDAASRIAEFLDRRGIDRLDLLIHNAGAGWVGAVEAQPAESVANLVAVNLAAPMAITQALLPRLARGGSVALIGSVVSALPAPEYAVYAATKAALDDFARNLRLELNGSGVGVQLVLPGATRTGMHAKSGVDPARMNLEKFPPAEIVAQRIARILGGGRRQAVVGLGNAALRLAATNFPGAFDRLMRNGKTSAAPTPRVALPKNRPPHCVVTGAAGGIGRALALDFARSGHAITGIDVNAEAAESTRREIEAAGGRARFLLADLTDPASPDRIVEQLADLPPIDVMIHNAGFNDVGRFVDFPADRRRRIVEINLIAPMQLTRALLAGDRLAPGASLVFVSSLSSYVGYPGATVYAAAKHGLASYARSLRAALGGRGMHVLTVFPGPTRTAMAEACSPVNDERARARRMPPGELARRIAQAVERRRPILIPGLPNRLFALAGRRLPGLTERAMMRAIYEKLRSEKFNRASFRE